MGALVEIWPGRYGHDLHGRQSGDWPPSSRDLDDLTPLNARQHALEVLLKFAN
jgi:hypothetical protein